MKWFIPVLIVFLTTALNFILWHFRWNIQHTSELTEKLFTKKMQLMEEVSKTIFEYRQLRNYTIRYSMLIKSFKSRGIAISQEERSNLEKQFKKQFPLDYQKNLEREALLPLLQAKLTIVEVLFGPKTKFALENFSKKLNRGFENYLESYIKKKADVGIQLDQLISKNNDGTIYFYIEESHITTIADKEMEDAIYKLLEAMRKEL